LLAKEKEIKLDIYTHDEQLRHIWLWLASGVYLGVLNAL